MRKSRSVEVRRVRSCACSEDRTAYVWEWDSASSTYLAVVVELRAPRAALCIQWAPNGTRFAVGLSSKDTAICYYEPQVSCWIALKVGKNKAAVGTLAWHPTSEYLATGSFDGRCVVYDVTEAKMLPPPGEKPFGEALVTQDAESWVNSVAFSPKGAFLAYMCQDCTIRIKEMSSGPDGPAVVVPYKGLPFLRGVFVGEKSIVAVGYDNVPVLIKSSGGQWQVCGSLDTVGASPTAGPSGAAEQSEASKAFADAKNRFGGRGSMSAGGQARAAASTSRHQNTITGLTHLRDNRFTTSGLDGQILVWELPA